MGEKLTQLIRDHTFLALLFPWEINKSIITGAGVGEKPAWESPEQMREW